jgi:hypothetical protein
VSRRTRFLLLLLLPALLTLAACGAPDDEVAPPAVTTTLPPEVPSDLPDLPVGAGDVGPGDRVRGEGGTLRVGGRRIDLAPLRIDEIAVVAGGVFFRNGVELWFTDLSQARPTPFTDIRSLVASADGRFVAFLDLGHGPKDELGTPLAISIAYDAVTGEALVASYAGMGDIATDDLSDLYEDAEPRILGFDGEVLLVAGATGEYRIPLDGSPPVPVEGTLTR